MDNDDVRKIIEIQGMRRGIIDVLNLVYPADLRYGLIRETFITVDAHLLHRDLTYLEEEGYVTWTHHMGAAFTSAETGWKDRKYRLTPSGERLANRINTDPSVAP